MLERLLSTSRTVVRGLRTDSVTAAAAVLTLSAAIGMNTAMLGLVDRALLSPPGGLTDPERLHLVTFAVPNDPQRSFMSTASYVAYTTLRDGVPAMDGVAAFSDGPTSVVVDGEQVRARTRLVSGNYFSVLGATPSFGRGIVPDDEQAAPNLAVLSHAFWMSAFGGHPAVVGRRITIRGEDYEIAGVMPRGFSGHSSASVDVWLPIAAVMRGTPGWDRDPYRRIVGVVSRVGADATTAAASTQAGAALEREVALQSLIGADVGSTERRIAFWLTGISALVLVIGVANAATLLLVRAIRRRRDWSIRTALGASRTRLVSHVILEASMLALGATLASIALAFWLDESVRRVLMPGLAANDGLRPLTMLAAAAAGLIAACAAAGTGVAALPARSSAGQLREHGGGRRVVPTSLLLVQTAVCVTLLVGAGMFGRSLYNLLAQDFGLRMDDVLVVDFEPGAGAVPDKDDVYREALDRVRSLPGVQQATFFQSLPFGGFHVPPIAVPGRPDPPSMGQQLPFLIAATPDLFDMLGIEIVQGRPFTAADDRGDLVVIVNETMAREVWPGEASVGKCIRIGFDPDFDPFTATGPPTPSAAVPCRLVIGVARDVRQRSVVPSGNEGRLMQYYVPFAQVPGPPPGAGAGPGIGGLLVRATAGPSRLIAPIRRLVVNGRATLPYLRVRPYAELLERQVRPWRLGATLLAIFGGLAVIVAAVGLYAAFSHAVAQRRREMAIRIAVGASPSRLRATILREAAVVSGIGTGVGVAVALLGGRSLQTLLFGIAPADPLVLGLAAIVMLAVALAATFLPALSASRADPNALLRAE